MDKNRKHVTSQYDIFQTIVSELPECTHHFFYHGLTNKSMLTQLSYARDVKYFLEFALLSYPVFSEIADIKDITILDLEKIKPEDINVFLSWMKKSQNLAAKTRARRKASVSVLFHYLVDTQQKFSVNPIIGAEKIELENTDFVTYLRMDEQEKLLECIKNGTGLSKGQLRFHERLANRDLAIVFLFLDTGLRVSELQSLNVKDVISHEDHGNPENSEYYVYVLRKGRKKENKKAKVYFSDESWLYISNYLDDRERSGEKFDNTSPLFISLRGNRISIREIQTMIEKYVAVSLGRTDISVHKLRSSFAMCFYKANNNDILLLQSRLNHSSIVSTNVYAKASQREEKERKSRNWRNP